ncbi:BPI fold-containing family A member 1 [Diceros bicornis minor]|uniref:BPI fold-containing family A member 1 n=1 Tax=Diceros bicornis minor TaxID=77932 RepID=UPI0026F08647|nr:BPI fold-containing family A member 1 [Diceros bicornis minor]
MFPTGGLIVFCGLLAQTTALQEALPSPSDQTLPWSVTLTLAPSPRDLAGSLTSALSNGLLSEGLSDTLKNLELSGTLKTGGVTPKSLFGAMLGKMTSVIPFLSKIINVKITNPQLLELCLKQSPDGRHLYVTIPLSMVINMNIPPFRSLLKLAVKLNITAELLAMKQKQEDIRLTLGGCVHATGSLQLSVLNRLINRISEMLPNVVQGKVCLLVSAVLSCLDTTLVRAVADEETEALGYVNDLHKITE